jgi:alpha-tubulin suppressor-like RCC1 family protein
MVMLISDGTAFSWGANWSGQLGDGSTIDRLTPVAVTGLSGKIITQLVAGETHALALISDGTAFAWGVNWSGQLGIGDVSTSNSITPVAVTGLSDKIITQLAAGGRHSLALISDGTAFAWGNNWKGQLGIGDESTFISYTPVAVTGLSDKIITQLAAGDSHSLALISDGTAFAWGFNMNGQLGDGTDFDQRTPIAVTGLGGKVIIQLVAGFYHSLALISDGTAFSWGDGVGGQLGTGDSTFERFTPGAVAGLSGKFITQLVAGGSRSMALISDGTAFAWGRELGDGSTNITPVPVTGLSGKIVTQLSAGSNHNVCI